MIPIGFLVNEHLVTCSRDNNPIDGQLVQSIDTSFAAATTFIVLSNREIALGFERGAIAIVDIADEAKMRIKLQGHSTAVTGLSELSNGHLVSGGVDLEATHQIKIWDPVDIRLLQSV